MTTADPSVIPEKECHALSDIVIVEIILSVRVVVDNAALGQECARCHSEDSAVVRVHLTGTVIK